MPRHSPDALKTLDRSHRPCPNLLAAFITRAKARVTARGRAIRPDGRSAYKAPRLSTRQPRKPPDDASSKAPANAERFGARTLHFSNTANMDPACNRGPCPAAVSYCQQGGEALLAKDQLLETDPDHPAVRHGGSWGKGLYSLGPPRDERSARTLRRQNPRPVSRPAFRQGRGEDPSRSVFFFTMMIENRQSFGAKTPTGCKACLLYPDDRRHLSCCCRPKPERQEDGG